MSLSKFMFESSKSQEVLKEEFEEPQPTIPKTPYGEQIEPRTYKKYIEENENDPKNENEQIDPEQEKIMREMFTIDTKQYSPTLWDDLIFTQFKNFILSSKTNPNSNTSNNLLDIQVDFLIDLSLKELEFLNLDSFNELLTFNPNRFTSLEALSEQNLEYTLLSFGKIGLILNDNSMSVLPEYFSEQPILKNNLVYLDMACNELVHIPSFRNFTKLQKLDLRRNKLQSTILNNIEFPSSLTQLFLSTNCLCSLPCSVQAISKTLLYLEVGACELRDTDWELICADFVNLERLNISFNGLTIIPSNLKKLNHLIHLNLSHNFISSDQLQISWKNPLLIYLNLSYNKLDILTSTFCNFLYLNQKLFTLSKVLGLVKLEELDLSNNCIEQIDDAVFTNLKYLKKLDLQNNALTTIPSTIHQAISLQYLDIDGNEIVRLPYELADLYEVLEVLHVSSNKFIEIPPEWIVQRGLFEILNFLNSIRPTANIFIDESRIITDLLNCMKLESLAEISFQMEDKIFPLHKVFLSKIPQLWKMIETSTEKDQMNRTLVSFNNFNITPHELLAIIEYTYITNFKITSELNLALLKDFGEKILGITDTRFQALCLHRTPSSTDLPNFLFQIFNNPDSHPDVHFQFFDGTKIYAHKVILSCRSKVFQAMFTLNMKESISEEVEIEEEIESFTEVIKYLYLDKCNLAPHTVVNILALSNKYDIPRLKQLCERYIGDYIEQDSVSDLLQIAEEHQASQLRMFCIRYLADSESNIDLSNFSSELNREIQILRSQLKANNVESFKGKLTLKELWNWYRFRDTFML